VISFPRPHKQKDLKSFLGLSGFYRPFIKGYGSIAEPLTTLLKKDVPFEWNTETEYSFNRLKALLVNSPVLAFPNFELRFLLTTDASNVGLGATLHQKIDGKLRPIAFASRSLKRAERSYHTTDRELLGHSVIFGSWCSDIRLTCIPITPLSHPPFTREIHMEDGHVS